MSLLVWFTVPVFGILLSFLCVGHVWPVIVRADRVVSLRENYGSQSAQYTGCIEEFLKAENFFKNTKKKTNLISLFCTLKLASIFLTFLT